MDNFTAKDFQAMDNVRIEIHNQSTQDRYLFTLSAVGPDGDRQTWHKPLKLDDIQNLKRLSDPLLCLTGRAIVADNRLKRAVWRGEILPRYLEQISEAVQDHKQRTPPAE